MMIVDFLIIPHDVKTIKTICISGSRWTSSQAKGRFVRLLGSSLLEEDFESHPGLWNVVEKPNIIRSTLALVYIYAT